MAFHLHCLQCFRSPSVPSVVPVDKIIYKILHSPMASTVRISDTGRILLGELAQETHSSMTEVLDAALDAYRRHRFLQQANEAYASMATQPAALAAYIQELDSFEGTALDGLAEAPP